MELTLPEPVRPMLAVPGPPPRGAGWAFEFKWDGVRAIVAAAGNRVRITSRNGNVISSSYPELVESGLGAGHSLLLDGEIVALDEHGRPDFGLLQQRMHVRSPSPQLRARVPICLYLFDLLELDGERLIGLPYDTRRERLTSLRLDAYPRIAVPPAFTDISGTELLEIARSHGLEGVIGKRRSSRYEPGRRSPSWVKTPLFATQEVVIAGWTPGTGRRAATIGSLLLGAWDEEGRLRYLGHVGTGFTESMLRNLQAMLEPLQQPHSPLDEEVPREHARTARWVQPRLVGEVAYRTITHDGRLRHATWRGLRPDKSPDEVRFTGGRAGSPR